jgi:BirA family transcriptional regulator, biotin operon repressor / biotin---[acetyl-CoA-carboxylase] ligase
LPSTQTLLVAEGGRDGRVVVADHQSAGRGRQGRSWLDVPGRMLMFSALLRDISTDRAPLISLAAGIAVARAIGDDARLKWPNDVRIAGRKVCGIIGELASGYVVVGIGVNVAHEAGELPDELEATSFVIEREAAPRRDDLCVAILSELHDVLASGDWIEEYRARCETIGAKVRVELADRAIEGTATGVLDDGTLVVDGKPILSGDVVHVR